MENENDQISQQCYEKINLTKKILLADLVFKESKTIKEAALLLNIKYSSARTIISKIHKDGRIVEKKRGGNNPNKLTDVNLGEMEDVIECNPQITLKEIKDKLLLNGINVSYAQSTELWKN